MNYLAEAIAECLGTPYLSVEEGRELLITVNEDVEVNFLRLAGLVDLLQTDEITLSSFEVQTGYCSSCYGTDAELRITCRNWKAPACLST